MAAMETEPTSGAPQVVVQGVKSCVVADSHGFIHPPLTFQKGKVKVWLRVDSSTTNPIMVKVEPDTVVYEALLAAKPDLSLKDHTLDEVVVKFNEQVVRFGAQIIQYNTSDDNPLLLKLPEPEGPTTKRSRLYRSFPVPSDASQLSSDQDQMIRDHRMGKHGTHVSLMWKGFAEFTTMMKAKAAVPEELYVSARKLMQVMSRKYTGRYAEKLRKQEFQNTLEFLGPFEDELVLASGAECDLALVHSGNVYFNIELKNEFASKDPVVRNNLYFVHSHCKREGLDPMLLLSTVSCHYFQAFGAVFGPENEVLVDPLSNPISVLDVLDDPMDGELKLARLLHTISLTLPKLKTYYCNPRNQSSSRVPYYKQTEIQYTKPISTRVWQAKKQGVTVAVKFTRTYGTEVHKFLAAKKMAPQLLDTSEIEGGWIVIEMEYLEGETLHECQDGLSNAQKEHIRSCLKKTLEHMKDSQFVHGDLRASNIMIKNDDMNSDSPTPIIIDFDWAGKETEAKYPSSINQNVLWPADVSAKALIKCEHDEKMVNQLFIY